MGTKTGDLTTRSPRSAQLQWGSTASTRSARTTQPSIVLLRTVCATQISLARSAQHISISLTQLQTDQHKTTQNMIPDQLSAIGSALDQSDQPSATKSLGSINECKFGPEQNIKSCTSSRCRRPDFEDHEEDDCA
ncbi:hypothetical protein F511_15341 [Dorcoceras hygrometricum]|uniref:Uncharacterized protein n=1 Tax=Dorcoceras hygrometricum TaxID=472368 RepID=A0A2Z7CI71_9LAMI|nr:hypothetical protein F511_15341 [Dorcoceras hygrometricum]